MLPIITVPHPTLRKVAVPVTEITPAVRVFGDQLLDTLDKKRNPAGVGLAAPQVDQLWRMFATKLGPAGKERGRQAPLRLFINPLIVKHSPELTLGPDPENPTLEGCLSMPGLYGPVPRWEWIEVEFSELKGDKLLPQRERFTDFIARVMQHEYDHLDGKLFTDYATEYELPVYRENKRGDLIEIEDQSLLSYL
jgi:peptide deformylase